MYDHAEKGVKRPVTTIHLQSMRDEGTKTDSTSLLQDYT